MKSRDKICKVCRIQKEMPYAIALLSYAGILWSQQIIMASCKGLHLTYVLRTEMQSLEANKAWADIVLPTVRILMSVPNPYRPFNYSSCSQHYTINTVHRLEGKKREDCELRDKLFTFILPMLIAYWLIIYSIVVITTNEYRTGSVRCYGPIRSSPVYLVLSI